MHICLADIRLFYKQQLQLELKLQQNTPTSNHDVKFGCPVKIQLKVNNTAKPEHLHALHKTETSAYTCRLQAARPGL